LKKFSVSPLTVAEAMISSKSCDELIRVPMNDAAAALRRP